MASSVFGNSYGATSAGLSANATGAQDITTILRNQLAEQAKRRTLKRQPLEAAAPMSPAAFDLLGSTPGGNR